MSNMRLWDSLGKTDPAHTKPFSRAGGFKGTAIKPMWAFKRMTEEFGPVGVGWGTVKPEYQIVLGHNHEVLVYCTAGIWHGTPENVAYGVGGDKVTTHIKANEQYKRPERWENDDEAFKKAYTDALSNAMKLLGVGADVHMGLFDDNKYVSELRQEFKDAPPDDARQEGKSHFSNAAKRKEFCNNVKEAYENAPTMDALKTARTQYAETFKQMRASGNEYDGLAVDEANRQYDRAKELFDKPYLGDN